MFFDTKDKKEINELYKKWRTWRTIVRKAANMIVVHQYLQDNIKELFYLTEDIKYKLAKASEDEFGMLNTSAANSTYQVLSKKFKGEVPMGMMSGLNMVIAKTYKKESKDVWAGKRTLRSYRDDIPLPVRFRDTANWHKLEDGNYAFSVYGTNFRTHFGRDKSANESIVDRVFAAGEYKFCDSSIFFDKKGKIFLNAVFSFEKQEIKLDKEKVADCYLSVEYPIVIKEAKDKMYTIGTKEEYLYRRMAIKAALRRKQKALKYNTQRDGRKLKLQALNAFEEWEKNFVNTRMHVYSRELINYCIKRGIGKIVLNNFTEAQEKTHEETEESKFLLSSWSYFNLSDKIKYKASLFGIEVEVL